MKANAIALPVLPLVAWLALQRVARPALRWVFPLVLLACAASASAQCAPAGEAGAYASATVGNGIVRGGATGGDRSMNWRSLELRFGHELGHELGHGPGHEPGRALFGAQALLGARDGMRVDFVHYNEGHPDNNHRDGFALQLAYTRLLSRSFTAELALGPYLGMNTTVLDGVEVNDARLGALLSAAVRWRLERFARYAPGLHLRLALNHAAMRDVHSSNSVQFGIGREFARVAPRPGAEPASRRLWLGAGAGNSITNQAGANGVFGASLEARRYGTAWAASLSGLFEGDDGAGVDRRGLAAQVWYVQPLTPNWSLAAGAGPYYAENRREAGGTDLHALITLQAERRLSSRLTAFASFSRVKTADEKNDRDLFRIGVLRSFGD